MNVLFLSPGYPPEMLDLDVNVEADVKRENL